MNIRHIFKNWKFRTADSPHWLPAIVPGTLLDNLILQDRVKDPRMGVEESNVLAALSQDCYFQTTFNLDSADFESEHLELCFQGLDTLCDIYVNNKKISEADNMFIPWIFPLKSCGIIGENTLLLHFKSAPDSMAKRQEQQVLWGPDHTLPGIGHIRKAHFMSGWDWGPKLPDSGPYGEVLIRTWCSSRLEGLQFWQDHNLNRVDVDITAQFEGSVPSEIHWTLFSPEGEVLCHWVSEKEKTQCCIDDPQLWWPTGMGKQPLYTIELSFHDGDSVVEEKRKIGLRTLRVQREKDQWGESFALEANGIPFFAKGANYIPEDNQLTQVGRRNTYDLLEEALWAGFNTLRIWGGGYYLPDWFYDFCDRKGLVVWQDFMFACSTYALTPVFRESVEKEARYVVRRLRHHPSIVLFCGNNEMETALVEWDIPLDQRKEADYLALFEEILPRIVQEEDPQRFYWPSSPSSGGSFDKPNSHDYGDVHDWTVWHGGAPISYYKDKYHRFLSEFGMQSFPVWETIKAFAGPGERELLSRTMVNHQKNDSGNQKIADYIQSWLGPVKDDFKTMVYASQALQAEAVCAAVIQLRQNRGRCMGVLYWQLNDCWPGASWSSIDYFHRRKMLHYRIKEAYSPVLVSSRVNGNTVIISVTNDTPQEMAGQLSSELKHKDFSIKGVRSWPIKVPAYSVGTKTFKIPEALVKKDHFISYELVLPGGGTFSGYDMFCTPKDFSFTNPDLKVSLLDSRTVLIKSLSFQPYVFLDSPKDFKWKQNALALRNPVTLWELEDGEITEADLNTLELQTVYHWRKTNETT